MAINSRNSQIFHSGPGSPAAYAAVEEVISISGPDGTAATIDTTHLTSSAREYLTDLPDSGTLTLSCNFTAGTKQMDLRTNFNASADAEPFYLSVPANAAASQHHNFYFNGVVSAWKLNEAVGSQVKLDISIKVTGAITYALV